MGIADFITKKLFDQIDLDATNENIVTCRCIEQGRIPIIARDDRQAIEFAIRALGKLPPEGPRIIRIKNTLRMETLYVTENLLDAIRGKPEVSSIGVRAVPIFQKDGQDMIPFERMEA